MTKRIEASHYRRRHFPRSAFLATTASPINVGIVQKQELMSLKLSQKTTEALSLGGVLLSRVELFGRATKQH